MDQEMDNDLSKKLKALSLGAIILVVFIHSYNEEVKFASKTLADGMSPWVLFIENFFSKGIARVAAPLFFAISGYLFYGSNDFTLSAVVDKLRRRFRSLVIPYLFWSVFGLILFLFLQSLPWSKDFFTKGLIIDYSFSKVIYTILVNPIPYQLWFIRDLIMLVILSPLIWYLTKSLKGVWLVMLILLWNLDPKTFELFSNEALLFFTFGCALALDKTGLVNKRFSVFSSCCLLATWLLIIFSTTYMLTFGQSNFALSVLNNLGILIGILSVWSLYDHINPERISKYSVLFGYSFIIFVFHEPLLTILIKGMFFLFGKTDTSSLLVYVIAPLLAIGISMLLRLVMKRKAPGLYNLATGGR
jgi:surface polysaccharide O-acyltransferase-like enzyme